MLKRYVWQLLLCLVPGILLQGCCVFTTYQTAQTLAPGRVAAGVEVGLGATPGTGDRPAMIDFGPTLRVGVAKNLDIGARPSLLAADVKYQFLRGALDGAIDLGVSYLPTTEVGISSHEAYGAFGLYPMVLFSEQHDSVTYSYGARFIYHEKSHTWTNSFLRDTTWTGRFFMPGIVLGSSWVSKGPEGLPRLRISPEISIYYCPLPEEGRRLPFVFSGGLGIQTEFGKQSSGR